ncbi:MULTISPECIES: hypothetical protein [Streptomyces]|uniref:Uncharacterized protein n=1 Tax=Streptomyces xanthii TaxID=2768069 RepID=A0A7H1B708_9ACTN|nr:hypothetical protein [Streptomyces xanthii]QNS04513.1 hypothetical protein IAG42_13390 [Streptomyces xanthii]
MYEVGGPSRRAWAAVLAVGLLVGLVVVDARREQEPVGARFAAGAGDTAHRAGPRGCGTGGPGRSVPPEHQDGVDARLVVTSYGYTSRIPHGRSRERFHVSASLYPERLSEIRLPASFTADSAAVDVYGPHGKGRIATARGLAVRVLTGMKERPVPPGADGTYRFVRESEHYLEVELPKRALCPGQTLESLNQPSEQGSNDALDYPVLRLTLTDPALPGGRLVCVSPDLSGDARQV